MFRPMQKLVQKIVPNLAVKMAAVARGLPALARRMAALARTVQEFVAAMGRAMPVMVG